MNNTLENKQKRQLSIGILAHVDAGKTTLAEAMLYLCGSIREMGRVDHGNAFLDTYELERARGITIFSKQARMSYGDLDITLLDTPGHVDFSAEMERTLQVLDAAILIISGADGVQSHVETLWRLLRRYQVPVFLFVNKMDQLETGQPEENIKIRMDLLAQLKERLSENCIWFGPEQSRDEWMENLAVCDEAVLEHYLEQGEISGDEVKNLVMERKAFPCYFGSALKKEGVEEFLEGLSAYTSMPSYPKEFGARIYKIARDEQGNRLTYLKVTGGTLRVKMPIAEDKIDQIRLYSGTGYQAVQEAAAGEICAVTGLSQTFAGEGLGTEGSAQKPLLEPVLTYQILLPEGCDARQMLPRLRLLEEEEPMLHIIWQEELGEIHAQVMGVVQMEVLKHQILSRFGVEVEFGAGNIVYKETILEPVEGVGHFEPLRHYAEVHLLLEPLAPGSGLQFESRCSEDILERNWQRLILTHLAEKSHRGVLTGSEITDMRITLVAGRSHAKHTEGGDFRQATYRAVRQGLRCARSVLLEPVYAFRLEVPADRLGRAMTDIQQMQGSFRAPDQVGDTAILTGTVPVASLGDYAREVTAYTKGNGRLSCTLNGYAPCHNEEEIVALYDYDPEADLDNPTGSVFCSHGAGYAVPWYLVPEYMHVEWARKDLGAHAPKVQFIQPETESRPAMAARPSSRQEEKELKAIFERTFGSSKREPRDTGPTYVGRSPEYTSKRESNGKEYPPKKKEMGDDYLLVDGYNIIFAWEELKDLARTNLGAARNKLMDLLCNYQGFRKNVLILVFDAYKVAGNQGVAHKYHNIHVVYTKEAETADQYIEKTVHEIGRRNSVTVATSDALEQVIILGQGARRMPAKELRRELELARIEIRQVLEERTENAHNYLFDHLPKELENDMEQIRLGRKKL